MKRLMILSLLLLLPMVSAVTMQNQTVLEESSTGGSSIQVWQDTSASIWSADEGFGGIIVNNLATFNSTYKNYDAINPSKIKFELMDDVTVHYSNGTIVSYSGSDFDLIINVAADESFTLQSDVPIAPPSSSIYIKPDYEDTVPHIILGRRLIFTWLNFIF